MVCSSTVRMAHEPRSGVLYYSLSLTITLTRTTVGITPEINTHNGATNAPR